MESNTGGLVHMVQYRGYTTGGLIEEVSHRRSEIHNTGSLIHGLNTQGLIQGV